MNLIQTPLLQDYAAVAAALPAAGDPRVAGLREAGAADFRRQGLPHAKVEAWRYTRLKDLETLPFARAAVGAAASASPGVGLAAVAARVVLVDGRFSADLSTLPGVPGLSVRSLKACLEAGDAAVIAALDKDVSFVQAPLAALASAYLEDGAVIAVEPGASVELPVEVAAVSSAEPGAPRIAFPRVVALVGENASLTLVESYSGPKRGAYAVDAVTDVCLGAGAALRHYVVQTEGDEATHVSAGRCDVPADARYEGFILQLGGRTSRREMRLRMVGEHGEARINGAYAARGESVCDTTTEIQHIACETFTDQVFKGVLDDRSRGIYQGKVHVHRDAQRIVGNQLHNGLLLSHQAEVDCKPELEIYADDVKCSHGATCGELSDEQVFYLCSRGIDPATARELLLQAFLGEALDMISVESVREAFAAKTDAWLAERKTA